MATAEKSSRPYPAPCAAVSIWRAVAVVASGTRAAAAKANARSRSLAMRSVMNPGSQLCEAGLSGTTPATGRRVRTAVQSPVAWVSTSKSLCMSTPDFKARAAASAVAVIWAA